VMLGEARLKPAGSIPVDHRLKSVANGGLQLMPGLVWWRILLICVFNRWVDNPSYAVFAGRGDCHGSSFTGP